MRNIVPTFPHSDSNSRSSSISTRPVVSKLLSLLSFGLLALVFCAPAAVAVEIELTWDDSSDNEDGFSIERSTNGGAFVLLGETQADTARFFDEIEEGVHYQYRVKAFNANETSDFTNIVSFCLNAASSNEVELTWEDKSDKESGFAIERAVDNGEYVRVGETGADITSFFDTIERGVYYEYRVTAFNQYGQTEYSNVAAIYLNAAPTISSLEELSMMASEGSGEIAISIGDLDGDLANLVIEASSKNLDLIDSAGIQIVGEGADRMLILTPKTGVSGVATIVVTVSDGENVTSTEVAVTVDAFVTPQLALEFSVKGEGLRSNEAFAMTASASDESLIESVSYEIEGVQVGSSSIKPYSVEAMVLDKGSYEMQAIASLSGRAETAVSSIVVSVGSAPTNPEFVGNLRTRSVNAASTYGSAEYDLFSNAFLLTDDMGEISGSSDSHRYHYAMARGDANLSARVANLHVASGETVAGIMLRSSLQSGASQLSLLVDGSGNIVLRQRTERGGETISRTLKSAGADAAFLRIEKTVTGIGLLTSADGIAWERLDGAQIDLGERYFIGLALAAGSLWGDASVTFDETEFEGEIVPWSGTTVASSDSGYLTLGE